MKFIEDCDGCCPLLQTNGSSFAMAEVNCHLYLTEEQEQTSCMDKKTQVLDCQKNQDCLKTCHVRSSSLSPADGDSAEDCCPSMTETDGVSGAEVKHEKCSAAGDKSCNHLQTTSSNLSFNLKLLSDSAALTAGRHWTDSLSINRAVDSTDEMLTEHGKHISEVTSSSPGTPQSESSAVATSSFSTTVSATFGSKKTATSLSASDRTSGLITGTSVSHEKTLGTLPSDTAFSESHSSSLVDDITDAEAGLHAADQDPLYAGSHIDGDETDHSDSDIISLSEEDISNETTTSFVITNVCSLSDFYKEDETPPKPYMDEKDPGVLDSSQYDDLVLEVEKSDNKNSETLDACIINQAKESETRKERETVHIPTVSSANESFICQSLIGQKKNTVPHQTKIQAAEEENNKPIVLDFKDFKKQNSAELTLSGKQTEGRLSNLSSVAKLADPVRGLEAAGECSGDGSDGAQDSCTEQLDLASLEKKSDVQCVTDVENHQTKDHRTADFVPEDDPFQGPHPKSPQTCTAAVDNTQIKKTSQLHKISSQNSSPLSPAVIEIKNEPVEFNEQRAVQVSSTGAAEDASIITSGNSVATAKRLACTPVLQSTILNEVSPPKRPKSSKVLFREKKKERLDAVLSKRADSSISREQLRSSNGQLGMSAKVSQPSSCQKTAVPRPNKAAMCTSFDQNVSGNTAATSSASNIVINLSNVLPMGYTSSTRAALPNSVAPSSCAPSVKSVASTSGVKENSKAKTVNDQVLSHLHGIHGKPGSQQFLKIPLADGSTHTVKVIFAPQARPPSSATASPTTYSNTPVSATLATQTLSSIMMAVSSAQVSTTATCIVPRATQSLPVMTSASSILQNPLIEKPNLITRTTKEVKVLPASKSNVQRHMQPKSTTVSSMLIQSRKMSEVSAQVKLSAGEMTALIQGSNQLPTYHPTDKCPGSKAPLPLFRCTECGDTFATAVGFSSHKKRMSMVVRYSCVTCKLNLVFFNKCNFLNHLRLHASLEHRSGTVLNLKSYTMSASSLPEALLPPTGSHHMDSLMTYQAHHVQLDCTECKKPLSSGTPQELARHFGVDIAHCQYLYSCLYCTMELPTQCSLQAHLRLHMDQDRKIISARSPYVCPECGLCFPDHLSLYQHLFATCLHFNRLVPSTCHLCSFMASSRHVLRMHFQRKHKLQPRFHCLLCRQLFTDATCFANHMCSSHQVPEDKNLSAFHALVLYCQVCKSVVGKDFRTHVSDHANQIASSAVFAFACTLCKEKFLTTSRKALVKHLTSFHHAYRFLCAICKLGFVSVSVLRVHVLSEHTTVPTQCDTCKASITEPDAVLSHAMWHTVNNCNDKSVGPFLMDIRVSRKGAAVSQSQTMLCRMCGEVFCSFSYLHQHLMNHLFWGLPVCTVCQRTDFHYTSDAEAHRLACLDSDRGKRKSLGGSSQEPRPGATEETSQQEEESDIVSRKKKVPSESPENSLGMRKPAAGRQNKLAKSQSSKSAQTSDTRAMLGTLGYKNKALSGQRSSNIKMKSGNCGSKESGSMKTQNSASVFFQFAQEPEDKKESPNLRLHPCHLCGLTYQSKETLMGHYASVHSGKKNVYFCLVCRQRGKEKSFSKKQLLVSHCVRKHKLSPHQAEGVAKNEAVQPPVQKTGEVYPMPADPQTAKRPRLSTPDQSPIKRLRVTGDAEQEFACAKCMFSSSSKEEFRHHITQHRVDNSVQCLECGLCFSALPSLKKHLFMVHRVQLPEAYVEQNSIAVRDLPEELVSHFNQFPPLGEQEFIISVTKTPEFQEDTSREAKKELTEEGSHRENMLECTVCYREFEDEVQLKAHMRTHGMAFIRSRRSCARESVNQKGQVAVSDKSNGQSDG